MFPVRRYHACGVPEVNTYRGDYTQRHDIAVIIIRTLDNTDPRRALSDCLHVTLCVTF